MDVGRRKSTGPRIGVVAGSVWESRMKLDEVKGGIKVFNGEQDCDNSEGNDEKDTTTSNDMSGAIVPVVQMDKKVNLRVKQSPVATSGKRKTWKSESLEGSPIQIARQRSEMSKNLDEQCKELSVSADGIKRSPILKRTRSESIKEPSVSADGIEKSPIQSMKSRSVSQKVSGGSSDAIEKNSVQLRKVKSDSAKAPKDNGNEKTPELRKAKSESVKVPDDSCDGNAKNSLQLVKAKSESNGKTPELRKAKSESVNVPDDSCDGNAKNSLQLVTAKSESNGKTPELRKAKFESVKVPDDSCDGNTENSLQLLKANSESNENEKTPELRKAKSETGKVPDDSWHGNPKNSLQLVKAKSESGKDFEDNSESSKGLTINETGPSSVKMQKAQFEKQKVGDESKKSLKESSEGIEKSIVGIKKTRSDENCKVLDVCEEKVITSNVSNVVQVKSPPKTEATDDHHDDVDGDEDDWDDEFEEAADEEVEVEIEKKSLVVKEISIAEQKPKKIVVEEKKLLHSKERPAPPIPSIVKKQSPPLMSHARVHPSPTKTKPIPVSDGFQRIPRTHSKLQSFVDLVMWRDASKSAFVFGIGTFFIISSSYTKDLNISLISVLSYLGLAYLAAIFIFRSFIFRGSSDLDGSSIDYVVGEEEAIWLIKLVLPYVNEFLLKLRALFSGDPATTMKMAVLLFVLARCGSSITIWKMAKLGFFGVFTVPKVCSSYSTQLTAYGTFWIRRFRDAWESCSHKKAVAFAIFTIVWNLSSIVARIWAVFMLFVAFRYYQNSFIREGWMEEEARAEDSSQAQGRGAVQRPRRRTIEIGTGKQKKGF